MVRSADVWRNLRYMEILFWTTANACVRVMTPRDFFYPLLAIFFILSDFVNTGFRADIPRQTGFTDTPAALLSSDKSDTLQDYFYNIYQGCYLAYYLLKV